MTYCLKFVLSAVMFFGTGLPAAANAAKTAAPSCEDIPKKCQTDADAVGTKYAISLGSISGDSANGIATGDATASKAAGAELATVSAACRSSASQCKTSCKKAADKEKCEKAVIAKADTLDASVTTLNQRGAGAQATADKTNADGGAGKDTNPSSSSGSGGIGSMGAAALGALGGGLLGYMMGKKSGKDSKKDEMLAAMMAANPTGALQANGTLDCSKPDAHIYSDCNSYLSQICSKKMTDATFVSDPTCQAFSQRYCGAAAASTSNTAYTPAPVAGQLPVSGVTGEGLSNDPKFCQNVLAENFCAQGGRTNCPSCLQIVANRAPACLNNPALCMAQNSTDQLNAAKAACPADDPMFANPANIKTGSQIVTELNPGVTLPAVTLPSGSAPAGVSTTGASTAAVNLPSGAAPAADTSGGTASNGQGTIVTSSVNSGQSGVRDGQGSGVNSQAAYGSNNGGGAVSGSYGNSREIASAGASGRIQPSSAAIAGPASDVQGQYGPSVFALGSQVIRQRCQSGKLNCP